MATRIEIQTLLLSGLGIVLLGAGIVFGVDAWASMQLLESQNLVTEAVAQQEYKASARIIQYSTFSIGLGIILSIHGAITHLRVAIKDQQND
jgi:hypothetical protein